MRLLLILSVLFAVTGCSTGSKYTVYDNSMVPNSAKVGLVEQVKCIGVCSDQSNPKIFTETLKTRLEYLLQRPVSIVPPITKIDQYGYYTTESIAEVGKAAGVDYIVDVQLGSYIDPSSGERAGAALITGLTAVLPVRVVSYTTSKVSAYVNVVRASDSKLMGNWSPENTGGTFSKCSSLTEGIADTIFEKHFQMN